MPSQTSSQEGFLYSNGRMPSGPLILFWRQLATCSHCGQEALAASTGVEVTCLNMFTWKVIHSPAVHNYSVHNTQFSVLAFTREINPLYQTNLRCQMFQFLPPGAESDLVRQCNAGSNVTQIIHGEAAAVLKPVIQNVHCLETLS